MSWLNTLATALRVGKQILDCAVNLLLGESCNVTFSFRGSAYTVTVKRV